jgi:hypothetical protein
MMAASRGSTAEGFGGSRSLASTIAALQSALAAEQAASYGYGIVGAHLTGTAFSVASADCVVHERARDALTRLITSFGATPQAAAAAYRLPIAVSSAADAARLAVDLEFEVVAAYIDLVAVADSALRTLAATNMQYACVRAARWGAKSRPFPGLAP